MFYYFRIYVVLEIKPPAFSNTLLDLLDYFLILTSLGIAQHIKTKNVNRILLLHCKINYN